MSVDAGSTEQRRAHRDRPLPEGPRRVEVAWSALRGAFRNVSPQVRSYLDLRAAEVLCIVAGAEDAGLGRRIAEDLDIVPIEPVSSRQQYKWMETFIATVEDAELSAGLTRAIAGKKAFRRFKDMLAEHAGERARWRAFVDVRLLPIIGAWARDRGIDLASMPGGDADAGDAPESGPRSNEPEGPCDEREERLRRLESAVETLSAGEVRALVAIGEFLRREAREGCGASRGRAEAVSGAATGC